MSKARHVYVIYIRTTPEKLFAALTEPDVTRRYWGLANVSDWKPWSRWKHQDSDDAGTVRLVGEVVECVPPRRLVITWAAPDDAADKAKHSRVTFETEPIDDAVRLTVTHDELEPGSPMEKGITDGWPRVLSSMKSFLETGKALNTWAGKA